MRKERLQLELSGGRTPTDGMQEPESNKFITIASHLDFPKSAVGIFLLLVVWD
jgi:hypothetical protein